MQKHPSSESGSSVLTPSLPVDVTQRSQRRRIIEAMIASCAEKTYAATTISDLVGRARISRTTFYKRFDDKRECFDATVDFCLQDLREAAVGAYRPDDSPGDAVRRATLTMVERMAARPALAQLLTGDAVAVEPKVVERYRRLALPALESFWRQAGEPTKPYIDPRLAFTRAQLLVFNEIAAGRSAQLPELHPEIVYLAVAPFGGHDEAVRQARLAERNHDGAPDIGG
jgi:AcrR family transcriptional regulator